jgi:hypothetical protein
MTTFRLNTKPSLSAPVGSAIMPVEVDVGGGVFELQKITQANLFASPLGLGSTTANTGRFTTLEATTSLQVAGVDMTPIDGTWTPTLFGLTTAGTPTYSNQLGTYFKIGKKIEFWGLLTWSNLGGATGNMRIGNLPFNCRAGGQHRGFFTSQYYNALSLTNAGVNGYVNPATSNIILLTHTTTTANNLITDTQLTSSGEIYFYGSYLTA